MRTLNDYVPYIRWDEKIGCKLVKEHDHSFVKYMNVCTEKGAEIYVPKAERNWLLTSMILGDWLLSFHSLYSPDLSYNESITILQLYNL